MDAIIALKGKENIGKSTTIRRLFEKLSKDKSYTLISTTFKKSGGDFQAIFEKNGKRIGITSYGDTSSLIYKKLKYFLENKCVIAICACKIPVRKRGKGTIATVEELTNNPIFIEKTDNRADKDNSNTKDMEILFTKLEELIKITK